VGSSTPAAYRYQINSGIPVTVTPINGSWSGTVTLTRIGPNTLTVQALSAAGTPGPTAQRALLATAPASPDPNGDLTGDGHPDLLTVGDTTGTAPGLWLTPGDGTGHLTTPTNVGIRGTAQSTVIGTPNDWDNTLITTGAFTGDGLQDILAVAPDGTVSIYTSPGDGSALTLATGTINPLSGGAFLDTNWEPLPGPGADETIAQLVSLGHLPEDTLPSAGSAYPDLIAVVDHQLWWLEHGNGLGNYQTAAVLLDSTTDWSTKIIAGTTNHGQPALLVRDNATGRLDLYSTGCTSNCANVNWFTDATHTVAKAASSALAAANAPGILSNDTNNDTNPDLWKIAPTGTASYVAGSSTATFGSLASAGTVIPPAHGNLVPMGAVNWTNPQTRLPQTDLYAATPTGQLLDYQRLPSGILGPPTTIGATGWNQRTLFGVADWNHDTYPDILARNDSTGEELLYRGSPTGFAPAIVIGTGWTGWALYGVADWDHDGHFDVIAVDTLGREWLYPGDLTSGAQNPVQIGSGWGTDYTPFGILDLTSDAHYDILARYGPTDVLKLYTGDSTGGHTNDQGTQTGSGFNTHTFVALVNYNNDPGHPNLITRESTGNLRVYTSNAQGGWTDGTGYIVATGW
jgi:hypothetical protein